MHTKTGAQRTGGTVDSALQERVNRLAKKGLSKEAIERQLMRAGWGRAAIREALKEAENVTQFGRIVPKIIIGAVVLGVVAYFVYPWLAGIVE
jgi:predicted transcriptional regulator